MRPCLAFLLLTAASLLLASSGIRAQTRLSGHITDEQDQPLRGAGVSLVMTPDGATTDSTGAFSFTTEASGVQSLEATALGFETGSLDLDISGLQQGIRIKLRRKAHDLPAVVLTAGSFEASNGKAVLRLQDIRSAAGADADVVRAIQMLPGTQRQGTETGLFVRGGAAAETVVALDGLSVQNPFGSSAPGVAARSRFMPVPFKDITFSSGGYSARYGQAMSSVLELNTPDLPEHSSLNLGLNLTGLQASGDKRWNNSGGSISAAYYNLSPYYSLAHNNVHYYKMPEGASLSGRYAWKPRKDAVLKVLVNSSYLRSGVDVPSPSDPRAMVRFTLTNRYLYGNASYRQQFGPKWSLYAAASWSHNGDEVIYNGVPNPTHDQRLQMRLEGRRFFSSRLSVLAGAELLHSGFHRRYDQYRSSFTETLPAVYAEAEWSPGRIISLKPGLRYEYSTLLHEQTLSPRLSLAARTGPNSQVSVAGGLFYQHAANEYLLSGYRPAMQQAIHYIASYQWERHDRLLRLEAYYKDYRQLVRERVVSYDPNPYRFISPFALTVDNSGYGYAGGLELFWRDRKSIRNGGYWVSYSYIDTRRLYRNFLYPATPDFISDHNLNVVGTYRIHKLQSQVHITYSLASGRPYFNPDPAVAFLSSRAPAYHNLAISWNYRTRIRKWFTVIYAGVDNATSHKNVFGYRYGADGRPYALRPELYRSFFLGINCSLTAFERDAL